MKKRIYSVVSQETDGGSVCPFADGAVDVKKCNEDVTCDSNCEGGWAPWGECSMGCHGGFQRRVYEIRKEASGRGARCQHIHGESETRKCPQDSCPVPCTGMWSGWSECSALCGGGIRNRTFELVSEALHGGECPGRAGEVQTKPCNTQECSHDCVGAFTPWSKCTRSCGEVGRSNHLTLQHSLGRGSSRRNPVDSDLVYIEHSLRDDFSPKNVFFVSFHFSFIITPSSFLSHSSTLFYFF